MQCAVAAVGFCSRAEDFVAASDLCYLNEGDSVDARAVGVDTAEAPDDAADGVVVMAWDDEAAALLPFDASQLDFFVVLRNHSEKLFHDHSA